MRSIAGAGDLPLAVVVALARRVCGCSRKGSCRNQGAVLAWRLARYFRQLLRLRGRANPQVVARCASSLPATTRAKLEGAAFAAPFKAGGEIAAATRHTKEAVF